MTRWHSLYLSSNDTAAIINHIEAHLGEQGYTLYSPFGRFPGMSYPNTTKTFVAPVQHSWVRVLLDCSEADADKLAQALSCDYLCISASLDGRMGRLHVYQNGVLVNDASFALQALASDDCNLHVILNASTYELPDIDSVQVGDVTLTDLPPDLQHLAGDVTGKRADTLFKQLSKRFLKTVGIFNASTLLDHQADWNSQGGQLLRAVMACLIPDGSWRTPNFATLRSAYSLQTRRQHDPNTALLPGDEEALVAIPNALDYTPVYGGKF